jgi:hypothetical protein
MYLQPELWLQGNPLSSCEAQMFSGCRQSSEDI